MTPRLCDTPVLTTERLTLRAPQMSDFDIWHAYVLDDRSRFTRPRDQAPDLRMAWRAFAHVAGMWALLGFGLFVFCDKRTGAPLGMAGPWFPMEWPEREIGWTVWQAEAEGKGFAFEAAQAARDYAYDTLGWDTAVSYIDPENTRSIALARRMGCNLDDSAQAPGPGPVLVFRHPSPADLNSDGSPEAYA